MPFTLAQIWLQFRSLGHIGVARGVQWMHLHPHAADQQKIV